MVVVVVVVVFPSLSGVTTRTGARLRFIFKSPASLAARKVGELKLVGSMA